MCIICIEYARHKDLQDARRMLENARREPSSIPKEHLDEVEKQLDRTGKDQSKNP